MGTSCSAQDVSQKIIGGSFVDLTAGPVALITTSTYLCTGVLIGPSEVLTAGHCTAEGVPVSDYNVLVGGATYGVSAAYYNPSYDPNGDVVTYAPYDTGMLILSSSVTGTTPVAVLQDLPVEVGDPATIYGYGSNEDSGTPGRDPTANGKRANIYVEDVSDGLLSSQHSYAGVSASTCAGDSGGPMVQSVSGHLAVIGSLSIGTNAYGNGTCTLSDGGLYSYVDLQSQTSQDFLGQFAGVRYVSGNRIYVETVAKSAKKSLLSALRLNRLQSFRAKIKSVYNATNKAVGYADGSRRTLLKAAVSRLREARAASGLAAAKAKGTQALSKLSAVVGLGV